MLEKYPDGIIASSPDDLMSEIQSNVRSCKTSYRKTTFENDMAALTSAIIPLTKPLPDSDDAPQNQPANESILYEVTRYLIATHYVKHQRVMPATEISKSLKECQFDTDKVDIKALRSRARKELLSIERDGFTYELSDGEQLLLEKLCSDRGRIVVAPPSTNDDLIAHLKNSFPRVEVLRNEMEAMRGRVETVLDKLIRNAQELPVFLREKHVEFAPKNNFFR